MALTRPPPAAVRQGAGAIARHEAHVNLNAPPGEIAKDGAILVVQVTPSQMQTSPRVVPQTPEVQPGYDKARVHRPPGVLKAFEKDDHRVVAQSGPHPGGRPATGTTSTRTPEEQA